MFKGRKRKQKRRVKTKNEKAFLKIQENNTKQ